MMKLLIVLFVVHNEKEMLCKVLQYSYTKLNLNQINFLYRRLTC